ncbi:MAG: Lrp/AsnC family transcriptional regulator [Salibacteraceae bacterium]
MLVETVCLVAFTPCIGVLVSNFYFADTAETLILFFKTSGIQNINQATTMARPLDDIDWKIIKILQEKGRITNIDLSREIELSPAPTLERVRKLEKLRYIEGYHADVNLAKMGITIKAFIQVTLIHQQENNIHRFIEAIHKIPEVVECNQVTGDYDYQLKVYTTDIGALDRLITDRISKLPEVGQIKSHIILSEIKHSNVVPVLTVALEKL